MGRPLENREHLLRVAVLFGIGFSLFLLVRSLLVPGDFGVYGHFRAGALDANRAVSPVYAGRASCHDCHTEEAGTLRSGKHGGVGCEACHGPLARHAKDPAAQKAGRPDPRQICLRCHEANSAKPATFPQVTPAEHAPEGSCAECHQPHTPGLE